MNSDEKKVARLALSIVRKLIEMANEHDSICIDRDFGHSTSLTLAINGKTHTHVGPPDDSYGVTEEEFFSKVLSGLETIDGWAKDEERQNKHKLNGR